MSLETIRPVDPLCSNCLKRDSCLIKSHIKEGYVAMACRHKEIDDEVMQQFTKEYETKWIKKEEEPAMSKKWHEIAKELQEQQEKQEEEKRVGVGQLYTIMPKTCIGCAHTEVCKYQDQIRKMEDIIAVPADDCGQQEIVGVAKISCKHFMVYQNSFRDITKDWIKQPYRHPSDATSVKYSDHT